MYSVFPFFMSITSSLFGIHSVASLKSNVRDFSISSFDLPDVYITVSSAYIVILQFFKQSASPSKLNKNNGGPRIDPCGTLLLTASNYGLVVNHGLFLVEKIIWE